MQNKIIMAGCAFLVFLVCGNSVANTLDRCKMVVELSKSTLPQRVDNFTVLRDMVCEQSVPKIKIVYCTDVGVPHELIKQKDLAIQVKPAMVNSVCSMAGSKKFLDMVILEYRYFSQEDKFFGAYQINQKDCGENGRQENDRR